MESFDDRIVVGYLRYYSDDPEEASVFLEDAAWLTEVGQIAIDGPGTPLTRESKIVFISVSDAVERLIVSMGSSVVFSAFYSKV